MGGGGNNYSGVNRQAQDAQAAFRAQQGNMYDTFNSGLAGAQANSNAVFNSALGGYNSVLEGLRGQHFGGGGGSAAGMGRRGGKGGGGINLGGNPYAGIQGPGNPWAGELGVDIRTRGNSILPSFYGQIQSEQDRLQNIQGGYNPGYTAQMANLARDMAHAGQENVLNTNIALGERSYEAENAQRQFQMQQAAAGAAARMAQARLQMAQRAQAAAAGRASQQSQSQNYAMQLAALGALSNLRTDQPGETGQYINAMLGNQGQGWQASNQGMGALMNYNQPKQPLWQQILGGVGALAPVFAGGFPGGGGNKGIKSTQGGPGGTY